MSSIDLNSITENASRLGMRLQEAFSEHTRDLVARGYVDGSDDKIKDVRRQLDSSSDREKLDAMKRLVALISKGRNVSEYFAQVVKNVASQNLEIRKLVYIYLLRYAEQEPDLALLSINTFQKDLNDPSPLIRAMALRVLSGIKVPMIGSIVVLAIKKCAADFSPYVRKGAALAIPKCYELDSSHLPALIGIISTLLTDRSPLSIGSVAVAFEAVCPTRFDLLHKQYRRLCKTLVDVDEWGQVDLLNLLTRYARVMLPKPSVNTAEEGTEEIDPDLQLLLASAEPLLQSRNPAVVLAVIRALYYLGTPTYIPKIVHPLLRLLQVSREVERVTLSYLLVIVRSNTQLFCHHYSRFLLRSDDFRHTKQDKIRLLLSVLNSDNYQPILREFIDYAEDIDDEVVPHAIQAIGRCAYTIPDCTQQCLTALMNMIKSPHDVVVSNSILVLKSLVQTHPQASNSVGQSPLTIISYLARRIDDIHHPQARACVLWLVGQYSASTTRESSTSIEGIAEWAPDVLRKSAKSFGQEESSVKLQIVTLAAKLLVLSPTERKLTLLSRYVFSLARYDTNYDVRDRARTLSSLLAGVIPGLLGEDAPEDQGGVVLRREQVRLVLFEGKASATMEQKTDDDYALLGSLSLITGKDMHTDNILPDWLEQGIESSLRDNEQENAPAPTAVPTSISSTSRFKGSSSHVSSPIILTPTEDSSPAGPGMRSSKGPWVDLERFYAEDEHDAEEESDEEEEEEEEEESDEEGSDESGDGGEDSGDGSSENGAPLARGEDHPK